jgi:hypothetical protein
MSAMHEKIVWQINDLNCFVSTLINTYSIKYKYKISCYDFKYAMFLSLVTWIKKKKKLFMH